MSNEWLPVRVFWREGRPRVDWCLRGDLRFTDPFFETSVGRLMHHPFHHVFRRETGVEELRERFRMSPGVLPSGFIFHESRCGSTLICQMLAAIDENIVLSEPAPVDSLLCGNYGDPGIADEERVAWLQWMVSALGQKHLGTERHLFIKFDCWDIGLLPLIRRAFPNTPWIFLYRDPVEVLVSQFRQPAAWSFPGIIDPAVVGLDIAVMRDLLHADYLTQVLARICELGLYHCEKSNGLLLNYTQLPEFVCPALTDYFGITYSAEQMEKMRMAASVDAKSPGFSFTSDSQNKQQRATPITRELAQTWLEPLYLQLEEMRQSALSAVASE